MTTSVKALKMTRSMNLFVRLRNDLNCEVWDSGNNATRVSELVEVVIRSALGNIINPGSRRRGFGGISQIHLCNAWGTTGITRSGPVRRRTTSASESGRIAT